MKKIPVLLIVLAFAAACTPSVVKEKPLLFLPDDLEVTVWAKSPLFYNPTNMDVDSRGRVWITEAVNYRNYNNDSSKFLHHANGDRVVILEDTDHDGIADSSKVFVQDKDLVSPLGIAVLGNKVFVSCSPNLIIYTDTNGDDVPDKKEIFLTGFGGKDHDHSLHSVTAGPDGELYFNTGNAGPHIVTDHSGWTLRSGSLYTGGSPYNQENHGKMKSDDGKVWVGGLALRIHPNGKGLKVMGHNFRNSYEVIPDSYGNLWQNDNDDQVVACRTSWLMEGGNAGYFSTDGTRYWQGDQRPWQEVYTAHWHQEDPGIMPAGSKTGAGAPTGVAIHEGDELGKQYRGRLLSADAGRNIIFGFHPSVQSSGFDLGKRNSFLSSLQDDDDAAYVWNDSLENKRQDKWFRPSDVTVGTDGAVYVADWYDPVVGGHQMLDPKGYGRIYRITPKGKKLPTPVLDYSTTAGLIEALKNPAPNVRYQAFDQLRQKGAAVIAPVSSLLQSDNPYHRARAIWLLSKLDKEGKVEAEKLLDATDELTRATAFRALRQVEQDILPMAKKLSSDPSPFVRREVVLALQDMPFEKTKTILVSLAKLYDGKDRWYLNALSLAAAGHEEEFFGLLKKVYPSPASAWPVQLSSLAFVLHPSSAVNDLLERSTLEDLSSAARDEAITSLAFINTTAAVKAMIMLSHAQLKEVSSKATYWLAFRQGNDWYDLVDWSKAGIDTKHQREVAEMQVRQSKVLDEVLPFNEKKWNAQDMARSAVGAQMLLTLAAQNKLPESLKPHLEKLLLTHADLSIRVQASSYFIPTGASRPLSILAISKQTGDAIAGKAIFQKSCTTCHAVAGVGKDIGPDLTLIGKKFDKAGLLDAVINPNAALLFGYEPWLIQMNGGESVFGFIVADGRKAVVVKDLSGQRHTLSVARMLSRKKQEGSIMPLPSALGLSEKNLSDLSTYLLTLK